MAFTTKDWKDRPVALAPQVGETLAEWEVRVAAYAAANPGALTAADQAALEDMEVRLSDYTDDEVATRLAAAEKAANNGVASLDSGGDVPAGQLGNVPAQEVSQAELDAGLALKQDAATAATDAELAAGLALKQDAATAATDAELTAGLATKQDAATAATDAELAVANAAIAAHLADATAAHAASAISAAPFGSIAGDTVQEQLEEISAEAGSGGSPITKVTPPGGNFGAAFTLDMSAIPTDIVQLEGTLTANATITISNRRKSLVLVLFTQDGTGGRTLAFSDGTDTQAVSIPADPGDSGLVQLTMPDATNIYVDVAGGTGGSSPPWAISDTTGLQAALDAAATDAELAAHTGDGALDGGPHGLPALGSDGLGWLRVGGALVAVDLATQAELDAHVNDATDAHDASAVSFAPAGTIAATTVQAAIEEVSSEAGGGGGSPWASPLVATRYYHPALGMAGTNQAVSLGNAYALPFVPGRSASITGAKVQVGTAAGAGAVGRCGIYTDLNGKPNTLVGEFDATVDPTATGVKTFASAAGIALTANTLYWLVYVEQSGATQGSYKGYNVPNGNPFCPVDPTNLSVGVGWANSHSSWATGALPASPAQANWGVASITPAVVVSAAA